MNYHSQIIKAKTTVPNETTSLMALQLTEVVYGPSVTSIVPVSSLAASKQSYSTMQNFTGNFAWTAVSPYTLNSSSSSSVAVRLILTQTVSSSSSMHSSLDWHEPTVDG